MKTPDDIFGKIRNKPFSLRRFISEHSIGIMGTIAFHMIILIVFLLMKIQDYKEISSLDLVFDFIEELSPEEIAEQQAVKEKAEYFERLLEQQLRAGNQAVNAAKLEEELSTEKYVEEFLKQLDQRKSEEEKLNEDILDEYLKMDDVSLVNQEIKKDQEEKEFRGPTNISYEFLEEPRKRQKVFIPIPVYKCQGYGEVEVYITVDRVGNVTSVKSQVNASSADPECLAEVAERYARMAQFRGAPEAPPEHRAKIRYTFIAQ